MKHRWLYFLPEDMLFEQAQLVEEGRDISDIQGEFSRLLEQDLLGNPSHQQDIARLMDRGQNLPFRPDYPHDEPDDLNAIRKRRPDGPRHYETALEDGALQDRLWGAWLGRCAGCLLGKPVEDIPMAPLHELLSEADAFPLEAYVPRVGPETCRKYKIPQKLNGVDTLGCMPEDDDTNYTVLVTTILEKYGGNFTSEDVAIMWMERMPVLQACTAERVAYRNFVEGADPPFSALRRNPYREWIGAQIRADAYGYAAVGNPQRAAEWAWRDARVSHTKNGIYGAMWVAAMLAAAPFEATTEDMVRVGLSEVPSNCRLAEAVSEVIAWRQEGLSYTEAVTRIHDRWDESSFHHWCHTISNAQIVTIALLWGEDDFGASICQAVQASFDTDCNGATVGSLLGIRTGGARLPEQWTRPLGDTVETGLRGLSRLSISELARRTAAIHKAARSTT